MRILVATDGSIGADAAMKWLESFPLPENAAVEVISASGLPFAAEAVIPKGWRQLLAESERVVDQARAQLAKRWTTVAGRTLDGDARDAIIAAAKQGKADLIVVGARGLGAVASFLLGSVSLAVSRDAPCAVLVCHGRARPVRKVIIAHDGSPDARTAVDFCCQLPFAADATVYLVGVVEPAPYPATAPEVIEPELRGLLRDIENEKRSKLTSALDEAAAILRRHVRAVDIVMPKSMAAAMILEAARAHDGNLIVVGARGHGGLKRMALGSVSESVLHQAKCPVLVVRQPRMLDRHTAIAIESVS
jgi:nucleotide-binding universal stress UspA family protein